MSREGDGRGMKYLQASAVHNWHRFVPGSHLSMTPPQNLQTNHPDSATLQTRRLLLELPGAATLVPAGRQSKQTGVGRSVGQIRRWWRRASGRSLKRSNAAFHQVGIWPTRTLHSAGSFYFWRLAFCQYPKQEALEGPGSCCQSTCQMQLWCCSPDVAL
ncbi:MAP/microtubule affinity-regulating kinase 4 [Platysternon megacephalum]|uniref:MAP/microtubule affinity-regulating kinase 4 n=1 Tax=Platysternon megacephalum TaxID=55544 RepID=A0A4D9E2P0_9SAUR|nr:MAP/microtubule affinity-regulating kinase 4 [Platysternon megacephalum]